MKERFGGRRRLALVAASATLTVVGAGLMGLVGSAPASAATTAGCGTSPSLSSGTRSITSSGQNRSYILRIPDNYDRNHPYKLIFGLHWLNGSAQNVDNDGFYGVRQLANNTAIFVAPQGINAGWSNDNGRDITLMDDIRTQIENALCVDTTQRFTMGFSYGGAMSFALACARPNIFRAVAVFSGAQLSGCSGGNQPVAYLGIHGTNDSVLNISMGRQLRDKFVGLNGCQSQSPREPGNGQSQIKTQYSGCRAGYPVTWIAHSGDHYTPSWVGQEAWSFFSALTSTSTTTTTTSGGGNNTTTTTTSTGGGTPGGAGTLVTPGGKCLGVSGTANASRAQIQTCNGGSGQSWSFNSDGTLRTLGGSMCLDASGRGTANGTQLIIYSCHGDANQKFAQGSNSSIVNAGSGRCVDVPNGSTTDGTQVQLYDCWGGDPQKWTYTSGGTGNPTTTTTTQQQQQTTTTTTTTTTSGGGNGGPSCSATYTTVGSWGGGFQGEVSVKNTGGTIASWTVTLTLQSGQSITSLWSGQASGTSGTVRVTNAPYNGALGAGATTSFGFTGSGNASPVPTVSCTAG